MLTVVDLLDRPLYSAGEAARLLQVPSGRQVPNGQTVMRWVDGYRRRGVDYPPVIRERRTGSQVLTWGEFVEARYLAQLRADGASLQKLRKVIVTLKERFGTPYPLAHHRPFLEGKDVVLAVQSAEQLPPGLRLVEHVGGQVRLSLEGQQHVEGIEWEDDLARALRPAGSDSPVRIDPVRGFGMPSLAGRNLRTEVLAELFWAGDTPQRIADDYDLSEGQVLGALRWEIGPSAGVRLSA